MGFYGNISNTSKTNFSFDLIYNSRVQMEDAMETDGVFLGRYVLIQYDAPPVQAYYNNNNNWMYNSPTFNEQTRLKNPTKGQLYQDLGNANSIFGFYYFNGTSFEGIQTVNEVSTPYAFYFRKDVSAYGRGYDATVWMKQFDPNSGKYKYVMTAELNAVVPTFHLVLDPPSEAPIAPYFDRDTTNIDYYLHQQAQYSTRIAEATDENLSDEEIRRKKINWKVDPTTGMQVWEEVNSIVNGDIFYNKLGFDYANRNENTSLRDEINYDYVQSGRLYGGDPDSAIYDQHNPADDVYEWRFRLPAIGNSICYMWDKIYGTQTNDAGNPVNGKRYINLSQQANDTKEHLVTYDRNTLAGTINTVRDMFGYHFLPKSLASTIITNPDTLISYTAPVQNGVNWDSVNYKALECLFYELDSNNAVSKYYYYAYTPRYVAFTGTTLDNTKTYYVKDGSIYKLANVGLWKAQDANGTNTPAQTLYTRINAWTLSELTHGMEDELCAILVNIHTMLGTNAENERDLTTVQGAINSIKDLLSSINPDLKPGRLMHTNVLTGQIEVTDTYFPGSNEDTTRVLAGNGDWVNRFNSMTVTAGTSDSVTNLAVPEGEQVLDASNEHVNNFDITTGNKWIRIAGDPAENLATFGHLVQPIPRSTAFVNHNDDNTEEFATQVVNWDEAGHIINEVVATHQLPMSYKTFTIGANVTKVDPETNTNSVIADTTLDTLQLAPGNKWVNVAAYDAAEESTTPDTIKFSHTLSGVIAGSYGLATDETITSLNADNKFEVPYLTVDEAGHITAASTETVTVPENFENVALTVAADNAVGELTAKAGSFKPTTLTDTFTLATTNKWIRANADATNRRISFAHRLTSITPKTGVINQNTADTFETYDFAFDEAGHVIEKTTRTITIPNAFKQFAVGTASTAVTDLAEHAAGTCEPDITHDTLTLYSGNKWIHIAANRAAANSSADDSITFGHSVYYNTPQTSTNTNETPNFGVTFKVPHFTVDEAGHINNIASHTVKIPLPSLTGNDSAGNVVTSVTLVPVTGAITIGRSYIGNLTLTGYTSAATTPTTKNVTASDSLNMAIKKLEQQVIDEASARSSRDSTLTTNLNTEIENREKAIEQEVKDRDAAIKVETDARKQAITDEETARNTAITNAINTEVTNRDTAINTAINGLVNGAPEALDTLKELSDALAQGDTNLSNTLVNLNTTVNTHIGNKANPHNVTADQLGLGTETLNNIISSAIESALGNFTVSLAKPEAAVDDSNPSRLSVTVTKFADTTTIRWEKQLESGGFAATESAPAGQYTIEATSAETAGIYQYFLIREYMGRRSEFKSDKTYTLTYTE